MLRVEPALGQLKAVHRRPSENDVWLVSPAAPTSRPSLPKAKRVRRGVAAKCPRSDHIDLRRVVDDNGFPELSPIVR